ncbi:hypothetical protein ACHHYP_15095, partial [Achlya hypogyna]
MAQHSPIPTAPHPTHTPERPGHDAAKTYMRLLKRCLRWTTPVHGDVWFRATLKMLPVNARYKYRPDVDPAVLQCSHGCSADETIEHALHACPKASALWTLHQTAWSCFGVGFSWFCITNIDGFTTNSRGAPHKSALFKLWVMLTGVSLHLLWTQRNHAKHRNRAMPPAHVILDVSFVTWLRSVRRWMRLQDPDDAELTAVQAALAMLLRQTNYRDLHA